MAEVPLKWKLSVDGANEVKQRLSDIQSSFARGEISVRDYAKGVREVTRDARTFTNISRTNNQIFMAMHPNINKLTRGFSTFASVARTSLSLMTSINTLMIAQNTKSSALADITTQLAEKQRELNRTNDPDARQKLIEDIDILLAKEKELKNQDTVTYWEGWANAIFGAGLFLNIFKNTIGDLVSKLPTLDFSAFLGFLAELGSSIFANPALSQGPAFFFSQFLDFIPGMKELKQGFSDWLHTWAELDGSFLDTAIMQFFKDIPDMAKNAWLAVSLATVTTWNNIVGFVETGINGIIQGFTSFVNMIISGFNTIIKGINQIPGISIPLIPYFKMENISLPRLNNEVSNPSSSSGGQIGPSNTYITVQGSVISERELMNKIDDNTKQNYKSRGFTGFQ